MMTAHQFKGILADIGKIGGFVVAAASLFGLDPALAHKVADSMTTIGVNADALTVACGTIVGVFGTIYSIWKRTPVQAAATVAKADNGVVLVPVSPEGAALLAAMPAVAQKANQNA